MTTRSAAAALIAAALALVLAPSAASAKTLVGTGTYPSAVGAPDGTSHVVWTSYDDDASAVHYCQVAPGTETCAHTKTFPVNADAHAEVVRNPGTGLVYVVVRVGIGNAAPPFNQGTGLWAIPSQQPDAAGGQFGPAKRIWGPGSGIGNASTGAVFGPGNFRITWMSTIGTPGARLSFGNANGAGSQTDKIDDLVPGSYEQNLGLISQDRLLVVSRPLDDTLYWRAQTGGDAAQVANWRPRRQVSGQVGGEIDLASNGVAPPALFSREQIAGRDWRLAVRRYDDASDTFTAPVTASDDDNTGRPEGFLDSGSNLHALFITNSPRYQNGRTTALVYTASQTGSAWPQNGIVLDHDLSPGSPPVLAAGVDGRGVAAWNRPFGPDGSAGDDEVWIGRVDGPASAWPVDPPAPGPPAGGNGGGTTPPKTPPTPPVDPNCVKTGSAGIGKVLSTGCFKRSGTVLTTTTPFLLNGLTVDPKGKPATVDTAKRTVSTPAGASVAFGPVQLLKGALEWTLPASGSFTPPQQLDLDKAGFGANLLGLDVVGDATLTLTDGRTKLATFLKLPAPFSGVSGALDLTGDNFSGLKLDGLVAKADSLGFGFEDLELKYTSDPPTWTGSMAFRPSVLPADGGGDRFSATIRVVNGSLEFVKVDGQFAAPGKALYPPLVFLRYAGLELTTDPLTITGKTVLAGGPGGIVSVGRAFDDFGKVTVRLSDPFSISAEGPVYVLGFNVGGGFFSYTYPGDITFGANAKLGSCSVAGAEAAIKGYIHVGSAFAMNAEGMAKVCAAGDLSAEANAVVSSKGIAACASFTLPPISAGAGHKWGEDGVDIMPLDCDTEPYSVAQGAARAAQAGPGGARTFTVGGGLKQLNVALTGDAGVPQVTLTGPGGVTYAGAPSGGSVKSATHLAVGEAERRRQTFLIARPAAGTWTVQPAAGSPGVAKVELARDAEPLKVAGRVTALRGGTRELRWTVASRGRQTVTLYEEGDGVLRALGRAAGAAGVVRWKPAVLRGGRRRVTAIVEQGGLPQDRVVLGTYDVPRPPRPGVARKLRASHTRGALVVRWTPARGAAAQDVRVRLSSGLAQVLRVGGRTRSVRIPDVLGTVTGSVTVVALRADGKPGRTARATVRAAPKAEAKPKGGKRRGKRRG